MQVETAQLTLQLTNNKEVLKQLKKNKRLRSDSQGDVYLIQFDGKEIAFRPGVPVTLGYSIARALLRDSRIIIGDQLTGEVELALKEIGKSELGVASAEQKKSPTTCNVCGVDKGSLDKLAKHLLSAHRRDSASLYSSDESTDPIDWEVELPENAKSE